MKLHEWQEKEKGKGVTLLPCINCGKTITLGGYYGRHGEGGSCSRKCEREQEAKPKYPVSQVRDAHNDGVSDTVLSPS